MWERGKRFLVLALLVCSHCGIVVVSSHTDCPSLSGIPYVSKNGKEGKQEVGFGSTGTFPVLVRVHRSFLSYDCDDGEMTVNVKIE